MPLPCTPRHELSQPHPSSVLRIWYVVVEDRRSVVEILRGRARKESGSGEARGVSKPQRRGNSRAGVHTVIMTSPSRLAMREPAAPLASATRWMAAADELPEETSDDSREECNKEVVRVSPLVSPFAVAQPAFSAENRQKFSIF